MALVKLFNIVSITILSVSAIYGVPIDESYPVVVSTWDYGEASQAAWDTLYHERGSSIDAIEAGCSACERTGCDGTVGYGGNPDENGETTLDALLMDGVTMNVGAVAGLRNIKNAVSVARHVLENTAHSLIVGNHATDFAVKLGFTNESLQTPDSREMWQNWTSTTCQPNYWRNVNPDAANTCGPYKPSRELKIQEEIDHTSETNHDTITMVAIDAQGHIASGSSTNGLRFKIPGRVGDSPIAGAGSYADQEVGAAGATGNGDLMMRFLPSFLAVELMRQGKSPQEAVEAAIQRIARHYQNFIGAVIALNKKGEFGVACNGMINFPYYASNLNLGQPTMFKVNCTNPAEHSTRIFY